MTLKLRKVFTLTPIALLLFTGVSATAVGAGFYTIIGPDGRPMIVPERTNTKKQMTEPTAKQDVQHHVEAEKKTQTESKSVEKLEPNKEQTGVQAPSMQQDIVEKKIKLSEVPVVNNTSIQKTTSDAQTQNAVKLANTPHKNAAQNAIQLDELHQSPVAPVETQKTEKTPVAPIVVEPVKSVPMDQQSSSRPALIADDSKHLIAPVEYKAVAKSETKEIVANKDKTIEKNDDSAQYFVEIDGVKYVNNEYLEQREFNLEGKKRFYIMPETGSIGPGHVETVEREKGVGHSLIERIQKRKPVEPTTIVLSPTYYRLPKDEVVESLQKACFTDKKVTKAKILDFKNKDIGFWPVAPIREDFAYEIVKLDHQVENILLTSYASSQKAPSYYWPLVVFLDQKGCVVEGVSGFKNQNIDENKTQHAAMEGVLKKPQTASYMFMTPLSSAVDAGNMQLTNQGQIKLSVIR